MKIMKPKTIVLVGTSSPIESRVDLDAAIVELEKRGFKVLEGCNQAQWSNVDSLSVGSALGRSEELLAAYAGDADIIWAIRGGYGASKILPNLNRQELSDKPIIGFSDLTSLQYFIFQSRGIKSIHGVVATQLGVSQYDSANLDDIITLLNHQQLKIELQPLNDFACSMRGIALGGNLSLLASLLGTPYQIDTRERIIIIEEVGEKPHKVDRMLLQMQLAGKFNQVKAVIFGDMWGLDDAHKVGISKVIEEFSEQQEFPVFHAPGIGHGARCKPFIQGGLYSISEEGAGFCLSNINNEEVLHEEEL